MGIVGDLLRQLAEEVVGDECPLLRRDARLGSERVEGVECPLAHRRAIDREELCDLVVAAPALQHKLKHGALIRRQAVQ